MTQEQETDPFRLFPYQAIVDRPPIKWPNGARVAVWVIPNVEHFHIEIGDAAPDIRNHSRRDYGNRVGVWRIMEVLTRHGVRGVDPVLIDTGRTFGVPRLKALRQIVLPAALPSILIGMRISLGIALIVAVVAEMIAGNSGIGYYILDMQRSFRIPDMFAGIFTLGLVGFIINFAFLKIEQHFLRWRGTSVET